MGVACASLVLTSCENDLVDSNILDGSQQILKTKSLDLSTDTVLKNKKFLYEGRTYEYVVTVVNDSIIHINDQAVNELFEEFDNCPSLVTYMHRNGTIEYFKNREIFDAQLPDIVTREKYLIKRELSLTNGVQVLQADVPWKVFPPIDNSNNKMANLYLCDDASYQDNYKQYDLTPSESPKCVDQLKSDGLNDKVTSFAAYTIGGTTRFELFEDSNFKDDCFSFTVYTGVATLIDGDVTYKIPGPMTPQTGQLLIADLKDFGVEGHRVDTWNDRISSIRITRL